MTWGSRERGPDGPVESFRVGKMMATQRTVKGLVEPLQVAEVALFLCSPEASFIYSTAIVTNGGSTAR
ncbi:MAG TPA: SDR family oxidoreductase [Chloroflexia bacterium]|nr:SDR family oxidoreductase [Chloroflexia bacterium]